jgi:SAM-dependent methyltransferase
VLDLGCGSGGFCALAAARGAAVHGVDTAYENIAEAQRRVPGGDFRVAFMDDLPFHAETFDAVTAFNALQYALDVELALAEAVRVARPGGAVAVCKYGRPADNEFFAFLAALARDRIRLSDLAAQDPVDAALDRRGDAVRAAGEIAIEMTFAGIDGLATAVTDAGPRALREDVEAAGAPYRRPDGGYRFAGRLKYRILTVS